ncbi:PIN domain-containing protein [Streptomyces sp. NPDC059697]|uniref:PIN domain-containing protein n=1 Tax=Streptomyces sp. NPDC059697 TaxID=3346912 RepID=UPI0036B08C72
MIVLDANILYKGPDTATTDLLQTIRAAGAEKVGIPSVALEELVAQRVNPYRERYEAASAAWKKIAEDTPWPLPPSLPHVDVKRYAYHWRQRFEAVADSLPADVGILNEALTREMNLLPPCKLVGATEGNKGHKVGARDAAIWLTAVEYARTHPDETVYFVSSNTHDFGNGSPYQHPMNEDLDGMEDRFIHLTNMNELVDLFTKKTAPDDEAVKAVLESPDTARLMEREAFRRMRSGHFRRSALTSARFGCFDADAIDQGPTVARGWVDEPIARLEHIGEAKAHSIGDHVWSSVEARWTLAGVAELRRRDERRMVVCSWQTRILISTTKQDAEPSLLRSESPQPSSSEVLDKMGSLILQSIKRLQRRIDRIESHRQFIEEERAEKVRMDIEWDVMAEEDADSE